MVFSKIPSGCNRFLRKDALYNGDIALEDLAAHELILTSERCGSAFCQKQETRRLSIDTIYEK